eukprot:Blabericola_migrator_1__2620@NODE_173_length_12074_cov_75_040476_g150_i0_p2_GENE_NODE_173_length_12074_cov_75_040476_g150_i0NODE_173_length_12074_cov_75_040476_g150_i0_p2_ORF_typecomplete_len563_score61_43PDEase_I/PF00233_19/8_5e02PDEase_I/PF00233_19/3_1e44T4SSDNA_transf/PF02534_14/0_43_NODE_173_length_12074_cov_75_040476_g150_i056367324
MGCTCHRECSGRTFIINRCQTQSRKLIILDGSYCDTALSTALLIICWCARWLRELTDRLNTMQMIDSARRVERARRLRGIAAQTGLSSVMEVCVSLLELTRTIVEKSIRRDEKGPMLENVHATLTSCLLYLTSGKSVLAHTKRAPIDEEQREQLEFVEAFRNPVDLEPSHSYNPIRDLSSQMDSRSRQPDISWIRNLPLELRGELEGLVGEEPDFDALKYIDHDSEIFITTGHILLRQLTKAYLRCTEGTIYQFLSCLRNLFWNQNPHHNDFHATNAAHFYALLLKYLELRESPPKELFAGIVAALGHDVAHPGRNSNFYVRTYSMVSVVYSDDSIMEQTHGSTLVRLMTSCPEVDILTGLPTSESREIRKLIVELILATDCDKACEVESKYRLCSMSPDFDYKNNVEHRSCVYLLCMRTADTFYAHYDWPVHKEWALRMCEERYQQGEGEQELDMFPSLMCERGNHKMFPLITLTSMEHSVIPILTELGDISQDKRILTIILEGLKRNCERWRGLENQDIAIPQTIQRLRIAPPGYLFAVCARVFRCSRLEDLEGPTIVGP